MYFFVNFFLNFFSGLRGKRGVVYFINRPFRLQNGVNKQQLFFIAPAEVTHHQVQLDAQPPVERQFPIHGFRDQKRYLFTAENPVPHDR